MSSIPSRWDDTRDVIVVGAGGAGLAAAVAASAAGASVLVLEACPHLGGSTGIAIGSFTAAGTALQKAAGISDNPEAHNEDMAKFAAAKEPLNNGPLRLFLAREAPQTLAWLMSLGMEFHGPSPEPPNRVPRMHNVVPNAKVYVAVLQRTALRHGAKILVRHRVVEIHREDNGAVAGVSVARPDGTLMAVRARRGVILAAGDYSNGNIKSEFLPPEVAGVEGVNPHATGDGHRLAREAGAQLVNMEVVYGPEIRFVPPPTKPFTQLLPANAWIARLVARGMDWLPKSVLTRIVKRLVVTWQHPETNLLDKGAILVNSEGKQFTSERCGPELAIAQQPGRMAYIILDGALAQVFSKWPDYISTAPDIAYAYIQDYERLRPDICRRSHSIAGLAKKIGVDPDALESSVDAYNRAAAGAEGDAFCRKPGAPLRVPPFGLWGRSRAGL